MQKIHKYPIKYISERTGFSTLLIRTWENRYDFLRPERTSTNRRLYSDQDLYKLLMIKEGLEKGFKIGFLSTLNDEELHEISNSEADYSGQKTRKAIQTALELIYEYNNFELKKLFDQMLIENSKIRFIIDFVIPLLQEIGKHWENGDLRISNEHFATALIRNTLGSIVEIPDSKNAASVVIATPKHQNHELIALAISVLVSVHGFKVVYIGNSVPAEEIITTVRETKAISLIMSIIYPDNDPSLVNELNLILRNLDEIPIFIGGNSAENYTKKLSYGNFTLLNSIPTLIEKLKNYRKKNF